MRKKYEIPDVPAKLSNRTSMKQGSAGQITRVDTVMMQHWHLLILQRAPAFFWTQHILAPSALYQLHPPPLHHYLSLLAKLLQSSSETGLLSFLLPLLLLQRHTYTIFSVLLALLMWTSAGTDFPKCSRPLSAHYIPKYHMHHCKVLLDSQVGSEQQRTESGQVSAWWD